MQAAGVPVVPGETPRRSVRRGPRGAPSTRRLAGADQGVGRRRRQRACGACRDADEVAEAIQAARREAMAAFGDGTLYVERLIERPRHVEVQVFADDHGHVVHLFERECSVQRRHQKVIEESPSPALTPELRARMTAAAVAGRARPPATATPARSSSSSTASGGGEPPFYFLEMNTRLQVEHPVTEAGHRRRSRARAAAGRLGRAAAVDAGALAQRGHAIEAASTPRIRRSGFLPQAGRAAALPRAARARRPRRLGRRRRRRGFGALRSAARQGHRVGGNARARHRPARSPRCGTFRSSASARTSRSSSASSSIRGSAPASRHGFLDRDDGRSSLASRRPTAPPDVVAAVDVAAASATSRETPSGEPWRLGPMAGRRDGCGGT